jgi:hypothetical protein
MSYSYFVVFRMYMPIPGHLGPDKWAGLKHDKFGLARKIVGHAGLRPTPDHARASPPARHARHGTARLAGPSSVGWSA